MKRVQALVAATIVTGVLAAFMLVIGLSAFFNPNTVQASNSRTVASNRPAAAADSGTADQAQVQQLENQLQQTQDQLDQANQQLQQYQDILTQLQQRGVIQVTPDGQILVRRGGSGGLNNGGFGSNGGSGGNGAFLGDGD